MDGSDWLFLSAWKVKSQAQSQAPYLGLMPICAALWAWDTIEASSRPCVPITCSSTLNESRKRWLREASQPKGPEQACIHVGGIGR
jgi:hypothetical protein